MSGAGQKVCLVWGVCCCVSSSVFGLVGGRVEMATQLYKGGYSASPALAVAFDSKNVVFSSLGNFGGSLWDSTSNTCILQGYGVRVDLTASTFINKAGITSSTFKTVPDVPVRSFELYLPEGTDSALHANGNLCKTAANKLVMPTEFIAQNGAIIKQNTKIIVTGCKTSKKKKTKPNKSQPRG
jgi:hypothetical protein